MRVRQLVAGALLAGGFALVAIAGTSWTRGWLAQQHARAAWESRLARSAVERARLATSGGVVAEPAEGTPVAQLVIPRIGLDDIVLEGVTAGALNGGPGHLPGSALPGDHGNAVISAHRDRHFRRLGELQIGDTINTQTVSQRVTWRVVGRRVVDREAPAIRAESAQVLTLTTCWPIGYLGGAPERLILRAVPVGAPARVALR